jgi:hypothetical protein
MPIGNVGIRICNAFAELSHPSPMTVEPGQLHHTASVVCQDEPRFQIDID